MVPSSHQYHDLSLEVANLALTALEIILHHARFKLSIGLEIIRVY
jgi:hypothetical protein